MLGISLSMLSHIESGRRAPSPSLATKIEDILDLKIIGSEPSDQNIEIRNLICNKSRSGGKDYRLSLPVRWLRDMDALEDSSELELSYDTEKKLIYIKSKK